MAIESEMVNYGVPTWIGGIRLDQEDKAFDYGMILNQVWHLTRLFN